MMLLAVFFGVSFIFLMAFLMAFLASPGLAENASGEYQDPEEVVETH